MKDESALRSNEHSSSPGLHPSSFIPHPSIWRVFCAVELPDEVSARVTDHIKSLRHQFPDLPASWNRDGKFHLTLKFIGEIPLARVERLSLAAQRATVNLSPFKVIVTGAGVFPPKGPPKVLWIGIDDPTGKLTTLQARLDQECAREGFSKEERAFHPHLTIARLRKPQGVRGLAIVHQEMGFAAVEAPVSELLVIRSELGSTGSKYTLISRHGLGPHASCVLTTENATPLKEERSAG